MTTISAVALVGVLIWEWCHKDPIIDLHLFKDRSFAIGNLLMFYGGLCVDVQHRIIAAFYANGSGLHGGKRPAGINARGFAILVAMPVVGFLLGRYDARRLLLFGMCMLSFALFHMTRFDTSIDFRPVATARVFQAIGLAFLFVPINTAGIRIYSEK